MAIAALPEAERQNTKGAAEGDRMFSWGYGLFNEVLMPVRERRRWQWPPAQGVVGDWPQGFLGGFTS